MKYTYAYNTSDGVRHEAAMEAESREAVFVTLRARGIKAIKVVAADGSKANGEIRGARKRTIAAAASSPRHQIYGDPAIMEGMERGDFAAHLPRAGDQMLAVFAQPGKLMCAKGVNPRLLNWDGDTPHGNAEK